MAKYVIREYKPNRHDGMVAEYEEETLDAVSERILKEMAYNETISYRRGSTFEVFERTETRIPFKVITSPRIEFTA